MKKRIYIIAVAMIMFAGTLFIVMINKKGITHDPALDLSTDKLTSSAEFLNAQKSVRHYLDLIKSKPDEIKNYIHLAQLYLQIGRLTGNNAEYIPMAQAVLDDGSKLNPESPEITITRATIAATLHQFKQAKELAQKAITLNPFSAYYYGVLCDAYVELGDYPEAVKTCDKMVSIRPDLRSYARVSYLRELHGDVEGAISAMKLAADAGVSGQENRAWVLYNLGMLFLNKNSLDTAEFVFKGILQERPLYAHALRGLAHVKSLQGKYSESIDLYKKAIASLDEPAFYEALGDLYQATGNAEEASKCYNSAEERYQKERDCGENNSMEMADFLASHDRNLAQALSLAEYSIKDRKSVHGYKVLALALFKNERYSEAWGAIQEAMKLNTKEAEIFYLAGVVADKVGNSGMSKDLLKRALSINPHYTFLHAAGVKQTIEKYGIL